VNGPKSMFLERAPNDGISIAGMDFLKSRYSAASNNKILTTTPTTNCGCPKINGIKNEADDIKKNEITS